MNGVRGLVMVICCVLLAACGNNPEDTQEHVWQAQEDALNKAKQVEGKVMESLEKQRQMLDQHSE